MLRTYAPCSRNVIPYILVPGVGIEPTTTGLTDQKKIAVSVFLQAAFIRALTWLSYPGISSSDSPELHWSGGNRDPYPTWIIYTYGGQSSLYAHCAEGRTRTYDTQIPFNIAVCVRTKRIFMPDALPTELPLHITALGDVGIEPTGTQICSLY